MSPVAIGFVLLLGVLFFGKNLPEVARQLGSGFKDLKRGFNEFSELKRDIGRGISLDSMESTLSKDSDSGLIDETEKHSSSGTRFEPPA